MTNGEFDLIEPELTDDDLLVLDDPHFEPESVGVVTGAASGIGQATAVALAANGLTVIAADIDESGLDETVDLAHTVNAQGTLTPVRTDLTDEADITAMIETAAEAGRLRYVANIAGVQHIASIPEFPMEQYDLLLDVMLRAPFLTTKLAIPYIQGSAERTGAIGNMSSVHGHYATKDKSAYITAKHGINGLTRAIAAEGDGSIRGFSVSVGYVLTPLMLNQIKDTATKREIPEQKVIEDVMLGKARTTVMMTPSEVANLFVFGFSSHATQLNGGDLLWDGGYTTTYE